MIWQKNEMDLMQKIIMGEKRGQVVSRACGRNIDEERMRKSMQIASKKN